MCCLPDLFRSLRLPRKSSIPFKPEKRFHCSVPLCWLSIGRFCCIRLSVQNLPTLRCGGWNWPCTAFATSEMSTETFACGLNWSGTREMRCLLNWQSRAKRLIWSRWTRIFFRFPLLVLTLENVFVVGCRDWLCRRLNLSSRRGDKRLAYVDAGSQILQKIT